MNDVPKDTYMTSYILSKKASYSSGKALLIKAGLNLEWFSVAG
jgi:hypothetical protein